MCVAGRGSRAPLRPAIAHAAGPPAWCGSPRDRAEAVTCRPSGRRRGAGVHATRSRRWPLARAAADVVRESTPAGSDRPPW